MQQLLVLNIPPELEDQMVDYLLSKPELIGFTSSPASGHGGSQKMSITEQVAGRRKRVRFELILTPEVATSILDGIRDQVGTDIYFWQYPITASGRI